MPRTRKAATALARPEPMTAAHVVPRVRRVPVPTRINARALPRRAPAAVTTEQLKTIFFSRQPPEQDLYRTRYGRALNLDRIEQALTAADWGNMRQLTDLSRETVDTDPHLAAVLNKRFGSIAALPWEVNPAHGEGIDRDKARRFADIVRGQLRQLPNFSQSIQQIAWGLFDGRAALEIEWLMAPVLPGTTIPEGVTWLVKNLGWIHPRRLHFGPEREIRIYDGFYAGSFAEVGLALNDVPLKFIQFAPQLFGDYPEREGLARRSLYWSFFKRFGARERQVLMELFGKPWRWLEVLEDSTADRDDLRDADDIMQNLGGQVSARFPRGTKFQVSQPAKGAGEVHAAVIEESDKQISKLVLGQTGTTDGMAGGLNNSQALVMQDEQLMILMRDATSVSEAVETYLTDAIIELNFGPEELSHAPHFRLRSDVPLDRKAELERLQLALQTGIEIPVSEAYEVSGFRPPREDEAIIKMDYPPTHPFAVQAPAERPIIVYPSTAKLPPRKVQPISPAGEGGLPEPKMSPAAPAPGNGRNGGETGAAPAVTPGLQPAEGEGEGEAATATAQQVTAPFGGFEDFDDCLRTMREQGHGEEAAASICGALKREVEGAAGQIIQSAHPADRGVLMNTLLADAEFDHPACEDRRIELQAGADDDDATALTDDVPLMVRRSRQPDTVNGSPEVLIAKGVTDGARQTAKIGQAIIDATEGLEDPGQIIEAIDMAGEDVNLHPLTRSIERRILQGLMLGALDAQFEDESGQPVKPATFQVETDPKFVDRPLREAVNWFRSRAPVDRMTWDRLSAAAQRRAFTVAQQANTQIIGKVKNALQSFIRRGKQLKTWKAFAEQHLEAAGFTPANPSHVETIFRTNVMNAHNSGRLARQTQPAVLRLRPFWQVRTVDDSRRRQTHGDADGKVLRKTDPWWTTAYPPFGFNCRCRVVSLSQKDVDARGLRVSTGADMPALPDPGFTSGTPSML